MPKKKVPKKRKTRSTSYDNPLEAFFAEVEKETKRKKSVYAQSRDSMCALCMFEEEIAYKRRDGKLLLSCVCKKHGITPVKLQVCADFKLVKEPVETGNATSTSVDLLAWTGV